MKRTVLILALMLLGLGLMAWIYQLSSGTPSAPLQAATSSSQSPSAETQPAPVSEGLADAKATGHEANLSSEIPEDTEILLQAHDLIGMLVEERNAYKAQGGEPKESEAAAKQRLKREADERKAQEAFVTRTYGPYAGYLDQAELAVETRSSLNEFIAMKQVSADPKSNPAEEIQRQSFLMKIDAEIEALLGDDYTSFQNWERQIPYRTTLEQLQTHMTGVEVLSPKQEAAMVALMERRSKEVTSGNNANPNPSGIDAILEQQARLHALFAQDAKVILSNAQHQAYQNALNQQLDEMRQPTGP